MSRGSVAIVLTVIGFAALEAVQRFVTTPGVTTDTEWKIMVLTAGPALIVVLCANWVAAGRPPIDREQDR